MVYLPDELYRTVADSLPIVCVDAIPVRRAGGIWQIGIITRATGSEAGRPALVGGRIHYGETSSAAIKRHLETDLRLKTFTFFKNDETRPFYIGQYQHIQASAGLFDPTKHSIALTYLIKVSGAPRPRNEASAFHWIGQAEIPKVAAFNQHIVMAEAFKFLAGGGTN